jgi:hypothetical protein
MAVRVKKFDAIKMSRRVRAVTSGKLNAMTHREQLAYLRKASERHRKEIRARQHTLIVERSA